MTSENLPPMPAERVGILGEIALERLRQAAKFPDEERELEAFYGLSILGEEVGEAHRAAIEARAALREDRYQLRHDAALRTELVHVAAVAVKLIELLDRHALYIHDGRSEFEDGRSPAVVPSSESAPWCTDCNAQMKAVFAGVWTCTACGAELGMATAPANPS